MRQQATDQTERAAVHYGHERIAKCRGRAVTLSSLAAPRLSYMVLFTTDQVRKRDAEKTMRSSLSSSSLQH